MNPERGNVHAKELFKPLCDFTTDELLQLVSAEVENTGPPFLQLLKLCFKSHTCVHNLKLVFRCSATAMMPVMAPDAATVCL